MSFVLVTGLSMPAPMRGFFFMSRKKASVLAFEPIQEIARTLGRTIEPFVASGRAKIFRFGLDGMRRKIV